MSWKQIDVSEKPITMQMEMITIAVKDVLFGASVCYLSTDSMLVPTVALLAGDQKEIVLPTRAVAWLTKRGCPQEIAEGLIARAEAAHEPPAAELTPKDGETIH